MSCPRRPLLARVLPLVLLVALAAGCASDRKTVAAAAEPVSGFAESGTTGLGAEWSREAGELVVVVRPSPDAIVSRVPHSGCVKVGGVEAPLRRGANPNRLEARVPYAGSARDLKLSLYVRDAGGNTVLSHTNRTSPEERAKFDAWLRELEARAREQAARARELR